MSDFIDNVLGGDWGTLVHSPEAALLVLLLAFCIGHVIAWVYLFTRPENTEEAWKTMLKREPRAVEWTREQVGGLVGWQGALSIIVGIVMLLIGLSLLGVLPPIEVALASLSSGTSPMARMKGLFGSSSAWSSLALGLLWGLLPCGLVFAMLVNAASTQTLWGGALTMIAFGLGTVPTLLGFGLASNLLSAQLRGRLMTFAALIILLFGAQAILRGLAAMNVIPSLVIGPVMLW